MTDHLGGHASPLALQSRRDRQEARLDGASGLEVGERFVQDEPPESREDVLLHTLAVLDRDVDPLGEFCRAVASELPRRSTLGTSRDCVLSG